MSKSHNWARPAARPAAAGLAGSAAPAAAEVEAIRRSLAALRRLFQRKELVELWEAAFGRDARMDYGELRLLDAVREAQAPGATVGEVARLLGVDASRASRQVARAVAGGLLARRAAQGDARKVVLDVTARGARLQERGSQLTRARIALVVDAWPAPDRAAFAALFTRFVDGMLAPARPGRAGRAPAASRGRRSRR